MATTFASCESCGAPSSLSYKFEMNSCGPGDPCCKLVFMERWVCSADLSHQFDIETV